MNFLKINPISYVSGRVNLPGSKSISNRILLLSALSYGKTILYNLPNSIDVQHMINALKKLQIHCSFSKNRTLCIVKGDCSSFYFKKDITIFLGNSGISMRSLISILSLKNNNIILTGSPEMKKRPIKHLVDALCNGGAIIEYLEQIGYPPIKIRGGFQGGVITVNGDISSQFLTSLLMASPLALKDTTIQVRKKLVSKSYIDMTIALMKDFKVKVINENYQLFHIVSLQQYISPRKYFIEGDLSSASYFLASAAIKGGTVKVIGAGKNSLQGDLKFVSILKKMGAKVYIGENFIRCKKGTLNGVDINMSDIPDSAMTIAMLALFSNGNTIIRDIFSWRFKETDRLFAMYKELKKIGADIEVGISYMKISPPKFFKQSIIETYNDHRIAMCFSLIALSGIPVVIKNPNCVSKTFPYYFREFKKISH